MSSPAADTPGPPADAVTLFVGALAGDRAALCSCALVQRAWTGPSQRVLFADVHVDDGNRDALFGVLQQARFTALIRTLTCCVPGIELHPRIVGGACLPALHTVVLAPVDGRLVLANLGELAELFRSLPALESLQLSYTRIVVQNGMHHGGAAVRLGAKELVVHSAEGIASDFRRVFDHVDLAALERLELSLASTGDCLKVQTLLRRVPRLRELKAVLAGPSLDLKIEGMRGQSTMLGKVHARALTERGCSVHGALAALHPHLFDPRVPARAGQARASLRHQLRGGDVARVGQDVRPALVAARAAAGRLRSVRGRPASGKGLGRPRPVWLHACRR
jgi:hypothetical protein